MTFNFILYKPSTPGNIGAAARAIKTMGFSNLRLIQPCDHLSDEAKMMAHASHDILENARVYNSFSECINGLDFIIGTTAKKRSAKEDYLPAPELKNLLKSKVAGISNVGVVFGSEESGLSNDILSKCDIASTIPMKLSYPSLNLGQAVMLYAYELSEIIMLEGNNKEIQTQSFHELKRRVKELLIEIGIPEEMPLHSRILERIAQMSASDMNLLHSVSSRLNK